MQSGFFVIAAIWLVVLWALSVALYRASKRVEREGRSGKHLLWLGGGALAMGGAAGPAMIGYAASGGTTWWAGIPLMLVGLGLAAQSLRVSRPAGPALATFREKSAAVTIVAILIVYGWATYGVLQTQLDLADMFGFVLGTSVVMAIVMALSHTVLAILRAPEKEDERDRLIGWRSSRNGYVVLAWGAWGVLAAVFMQAPQGLLAYAILEIFVLAELVRLVSELVYYRLDV